MTDDAPARTMITVEGIHKTFKLPHERYSGIKQIFVNVFRGRSGFERQKVLKDISFDIKEGEFFGIVGRNGSGKSTLLKLLAGIYVPDSGIIQVRGSLTPFIELGVGFNPELTGKENVFLNGALLGFSRKEMEAMYDDIVSFAELERFMDQKLKNYSSGMQVRLAFSIAIRARSDILLIDEVLAVGDAIFQKKCFNYFKQLKRDGRTVVFISHDANALLEYCDRGVLIDKGKIVTKGKISDVVHNYIDLLNGVEEAQSQEATEGGKRRRWGAGGAKVNSVRMYSPKEPLKDRRVFNDSDDRLGIAVEFMPSEALESPVYGLTITSASGDRMFASNTLWSKVATKDMVPGKPVTVRWEFPNTFNTGDFAASPAVSDNRGSVVYDWWEDAAFFKIRKRLQSSAHINVAHELEVEE